LTIDSLFQRTRVKLERRIESIHPVIVKLWAEIEVNVFDWAPLHRVLVLLGETPKDTKNGVK